MKKTNLTQDKVALIDDEDFERVNKYKWYAAKYNNTYYAKNKKIGYLHRFILKYDGDLHTDHKDGDGLNNQKENLRLVTYAQNQMNSPNKKSSKATSKYKGVSLDKRSNRYRVRIGLEKGKSKQLASYVKDEVEAAKIYDEAAKKYFGEYAKLNFNG